MPFDPSKGSDWATIAATILAFVTTIFAIPGWLFRRFATVKNVEATYLRKHTDTIDGVEYKGADTQYAPINDMAETRRMHAEAMEESRLLREQVKEWMRHP